MATRPKRNPSLDVVRILALFLVVSIHFFLNIGYYNVIFEGDAIFWMTILRSFCKACVPLFILLSGYLMNRKKLCGKYYVGIIKTVAVYLLACGACEVYRVYYMEKPFALRKFVLGILDFSAASYGWYVEMYVCLFLMIPFINAMYHGMETPKKKLALLGTFIFITASYTVFNIFDFHTPGWWDNMLLSTKYDEMVPDYFVGMYPITVYLIGCALSDFKVKLNRILNLVLLALAVFALGGFCYHRCLGGKFVWGVWQSDGAFLPVTIAVLLFIFISGFDMTGLPRFISWILKKISDSVFGAYLVSWIFDKAFYPKLLAAVPKVADRYVYYFRIVPVIFGCSILLSLFLNFIWNTVSFVSVKGVLFGVKCLKRKDVGASEPCPSSEDKGKEAEEQKIAK